MRVAVTWEERSTSTVAGRGNSAWSTNANPRLDEFEGRSVDPRSIPILADPSK